MLCVVDMVCGPDWGQPRVLPSGLTTFLSHAPPAPAFPLKPAVGPVGAMGVTDSKKLTGSSSTGME
jgi:hypothetical protein